jgi:hypothetical protein
MQSIHRLTAVGRRAFLIGGSTALLIGIIVVFNATLTRTNDAAGRADQARQALADIQARLDATNAELDFAINHKEAFTRWQAPLAGYGEQGERQFALPADAPSPQPIVPIGPQAVERPPMAPFDAWMELLFGT